MASINYVKFLRGTPTAYSNLTTKDDNTLYFISESGANSGSLYLGNKLISGSGSSSGATTLDELTDVVISTVANKQILVYNSTTAKWENGFISDIIDTIIDSNCLVKNADGKYTLLGFGDAAVGSIPQKGTDGTLKWVSDFYSKSEVDALVAGRLKRKKVDSVSAIDTSAADAELYIYLVPATNSSTGNLYDEYVVIDGAVELLNSAPIDTTGFVTTSSLATTLEGYITTTKYNDEIGSISDLTKDDGVTTLIGQVNAINDRLIWSEMA